MDQQNPRHPVPKGKRLVEIGGDEQAGLTLDDPVLDFVSQALNPARCHVGQIGGGRRVAAERMPERVNAGPQEVFPILTAVDLRPPLPVVLVHRLPASPLLHLEHFGGAGFIGQQIFVGRYQWIRHVRFSRM